MKTDYVQQMKRVKVPFYYRWLGAYRARQCRKAARKEIRYVATVTDYTKFTPREGKPFLLQSWFVLKETGDGKRFYEFTKQNHSSDKEACWVYTHIVLPWTLGHWTNKAVIDWVAKQKVPNIDA